MKKFLLFCFPLLIPFLSFSQATWNKELPGTAYVEGCIATSDGGVAVVTYLQHRIHKLDENGDLLWTFAVDTSAMVKFSSIAETSDGGLIALGATTGFDGICAFKLDENGTLQWQKLYSHQFGDLTTQFVCASHDGAGFIFGGGNCALQFYATRCDSLGNILWTKEHSGLTQSATGFFSAMTQAPGNKYVATYSTLANGDLDWGILNLDDNGLFQWAKMMDEGVSRDEAYDIVKTQDGGTAVLGITTNYQGASLEYMMTLTTFDATGNRLSYHVYDYFEQLQPRKLTQTADGGFFLTGSTYGLEALLVKTDATGNIQWQKLGTGAITQESFGVAPAPGGMMYLSAWDFTHKSTIAKISPLTGVGICTESPLQLSPASYQPPIVTPQVTQFNSTIIANALNYATFMEPGEATMICTFVGNEEANLPFEMEVSPNPFRDRLHIDWGISSESEGILRLLDLQGRVLATKEVQQGIQGLDWQLPELGSGMLLLQYESDGVARTVKLVGTGN
jgi:hypothetical protein